MGHIRDEHEHGNLNNGKADYSSMSMRAQQALEQRQQKLKKLAKQLEEKYGRVCSHKPEITQYEFKEKRDSFHKTIDQHIRRRQEMIERNEAKKMEEELSGVTFQPKISPYSQQLERGEEPIHERLFRMAKSISERSKNDSVPIIVVPSPRMSREGSVEERMYKEAEELRNRREQQQRERMLDIQHQMEQKILNERSEEMARTRQERLLRNVFEEVAQKQRDHINFIELGGAMKRLGLFKSNAPQHERKNEEEVKIHEALWEVMDSEESGWVDMETFMWIMLPILTSTDDVEDEETRRVLRRLQREIRLLHSNRLAYTKTKNVKSKVANETEFTPRSSVSSVSGRGREAHTDVEAAAGETGQGHGKDDEESISKQKISHRYEKLLKKKKAVEDRLEQERKRTEERRMQECTFAPQISSNYKIKRKRETGKPRYEVLYEKAAESRRSEPTLTLKEQRELKHCTFQPNRTRTKNFNAVRSSAPTKPRGFDQVIQRMRKVQREKEELKEHEESLMQAKNWSSEKTKPRPFNFELDRRQRQRAVLYMDINLGPGRTGRIGIHNGDHPYTVAKNFAQSYRLDDILTKRLEELVRENMEQNGIEIGGWETPRKSAGSDKLKRLSKGTSTMESNGGSSSSSSAGRSLKMRFSNNSLDLLSMNSSERSLDEDFDIELDMRAAQSFENYERDEQINDDEQPMEMEEEFESPSKELIKSLQQLRAFTRQENHTIDNNLLSLDLGEN